jgi:hypothetical protein
MTPFGGGLLSAFSDPPEWPTKNLYLQVLTEGFAGEYGGTSMMINAERMVRAFCGLGIATRLFAHQHKFSLNPIRPHFYIHRKRPDGSWDPDNCLTVGDVTDAGLRGLEMHLLDGKLVTEESKAAWAQFRLSEIAAVFSTGKKGQPILLAGQWLFDSHAGREELLSFVQAMVVLEILLGDKKTSDQIGLGELLRNRCAYLIGTSQEDRNALLDNFNQIYHGRKRKRKGARGTRDSPAERTPVREDGHRKLCGTAEQPGGKRIVR